MAKHNDRYSIQIYWWEEGNCWYACAPELIGVFETGNTRAEVLSKLEETLQEVSEEYLSEFEPWIMHSDDETFPLYLD